MILRNWALVVLFAFPQGLQAALPTVLVLVPMMAAAGAMAFFVILRSRKSMQENSQQSEQQVPQKRLLRSPLELRSVLRFGILFLSL